VLFVGVALAAVGFVLGSLGPCLILLARDFGVPRGELAWLSSGFGASLIVAGLAGPWLLGLGPARVLRFGAAGLAAGTALLSVAPTLLVAQAGALLLGVGGAGIVLANPVLLAGPGAARRLTSVNAGASVAALSSPLLMGALDALAGNGRLALLIPVAPLLWVAVGSGKAAWSEGEAGPVRAPDAPRGPGAPQSLHVAAAWISLATAVSAEFVYVVWSAARLQDSGLDPAAAAAAASSFQIGMAAGRMVAPRLIGKVSVVVPGVALGIFGALVAATPAGPRLLTAALGAAGFGVAVLYPVLLARLVATPGLTLYKGSSLGASASGAAALGSPIVLAVLASLLSLRIAFLAAVPLLLLVLVLRRRGARDGR
jgi:MFS family permease